MLRRGSFLWSWWTCGENVPTLTGSELCNVTRRYRAHYVIWCHVVGKSALPRASSSELFSTMLSTLRGKSLPHRFVTPFVFSTSRFYYFFADIIKFPAIAVMSLCSAPLVPLLSHLYPRPQATPFICIEEEQLTHRHFSSLHVLSPLPLLPPRSPKMFPAPTRSTLPLTRPGLNSDQAPSSRQ